MVYKNDIGTGSGSDCIRRFYNPTVNFVAPGFGEMEDRFIYMGTHICDKLRDILTYYFTQTYYKIIPL